MSAAPEGIYNPSRQGLERVSGGGSRSKSGRQPGTWREETAEREGGGEEFEALQPVLWGAGLAAVSPAPAPQLLPSPLRLMLQSVVKLTRAER